jgi:hypothetical protein
MPYLSPLRFRSDLAFFKADTAAVAALAVIQATVGDW